MAAGDLENIRPVDKSGNIANLTRNINYVDSNNVMHSVAEVYWSDAQGQTHLIWKRDHTPGPSDTYETFYNNDDILFFEYRPDSNTTSINSIAIWGDANGQSWSTRQIDIWDVTDSSNYSLVYNQQTAFTETRETLNVDGTDRNVDVFSLSGLNISVEAGHVYYITLAFYNSAYFRPIAFTGETGNYWLVPGNQSWVINNSEIPKYRVEYTNHKIKAKVNGVQV